MLSPFLYEQWRREMTIEEFAAYLKELLRKAEDSGLDVEEFCAVAEDIIANGWRVEG